MKQQKHRSVKRLKPGVNPISEYRVKLRQVGMRLDQFLAGEANVSREEVKRLIESGGVQVDKSVVKESRTRLRLGMEIAWRKQDLEGRLEEQLSKTFDVSQLTPRVLAETDDILVLSKPAGLSMHPVGRSAQATLSQWISTHYPHIVGVGEVSNRPGMVHRLDKETSGIVLIAKHNKAFKALKSLFQERRIQKEYLALVYGNVKVPAGTIDTPIGRVKGSLRRATPVGRRSFGGELREAVTEYSLHTRYPQYDLLFVKPKTGRTHQIRVHLASLGYPVVGDRLYRFKGHRQDPLIPPFHLLHAAGISFSLSGKQYRFEAPLPQYFQDSLSLLALRKADRV